MTASSLAVLPAGCDVFIDANIFIYGLTDEGSESRAFLRRCSREEVFGVTLFEIVNEATHVFMVSEAFAEGMITKRSAYALASRLDEIRSLKSYWVYTERMLRLNIVFLATERAILDQAHVERRSAGLLTNDSMIVACMRNLGVTRLASSDSGFDHVQGIERFAPTDLH